MLVDAAKDIGTSNYKLQVKEKQEGMSLSGRLIGCNTKSPFL
jgi:hypothetical protein